MSENTLEQVLKRVDEHLTQKESVSSKVLYDVIDSVKAVKKDMQRLEKALTEFVHAVELKHKDLEHSVETNKSKVDSHGKMLLWVAMSFGGAIILALSNLIIK